MQSRNETQEVHQISTLDQICNELRAAARDSQNPHRFQHSIALAFEFLGFDVTELGKPGETDLLLEAPIGSESYTVIVDAKSRHDGKLQELSAHTATEHRRHHKASFALVVAEAFAGHKIIRHAEANQITLLSVHALIEWLLLHQQTPLDLHIQRPLFVTHGLLNELPAEVTLATTQHTMWGQLIVDLIELIQVTYKHGLKQPLPDGQLFGMLVTRLQGVHYSAEEVRLALAFLGHPIVGALATDPEGITLKKSLTSVAQTLQALSKQLEEAMNDPSE